MLHLNYVAPERIYWEYSAGLVNSQVFRLDFAWRELKTIQKGKISHRLVWFLLLNDELVVRELQ
jgi:hypothetical protein